MVKHGEKKGRMTLIERQRLESGDAPMLATLRISELDKLVARLKQNQANCQVTIQLDEQQLYHIDKEIEKILIRYQPMCKRLEQRKELRATLQSQVEKMSGELGQLVSVSRNRLKQSNNEEVRHLRREANTELTAARGYNLGRGSTMIQKSRRK